MRPPNSDCIHITPSAAHLPIAESQIGLPENLAFGPCRADPAEHSVVRQQFWKSALNQDRDDIYAREQILAELSSFPDSAPIVLWTTPVWREQLRFWWLADSFSKLYELDPNRFWMVGSVVKDRDDPSLVYPLGAHNEDQLQAAFEKAEHIKPDFFIFAAQLWRAFSGDNPSLFCQLRNESHTFSSDWRQKTDPYRFGFPQMTTDGGLKLSEWDQFLLTFLDSKESIRPVDIIGASEPYSLPICLYLDSFLPARLRCWSEYRPDNPAIISEPREGVNQFTRIAYRLTETGHRILHEGMNDLSEAPPMDVGGVQAYRDPWVVQWQGEDWNIRD